MFKIPQIGSITEDLPKGFYRIDHDVYHESIGYSSTRVKKALGSYAQFIKPDKDSDAFRFGRAFHMALLEPHLFKTDYVKEPVIDGHPNSNLYKEAKASWRASAMGKEALTNAEYSTVMDMCTAVLGHPEFSLKDYEPEIMAITRCKDTGLLLKCKSDMFGGVVTDIKTTSGSVKPHEFMKDLTKYGYHVSLAFYQDIIADIVGMPPTMKIMAVEKREPYDCALFTISDSILEEGRKLYKAALRRIAKWIAMPINEIHAENKTFTLEANAYMRYNSQDILKYIGEV